jgi:soluble lytic murein transglycosylase
MKRILALLFLALAFSACDLLDPSATPLPPVQSASATPAVATLTSTLPPTLTPTITPTPLPTMLPVVRVERGDAAVLAGDYDQALEEYAQARKALEDVQVQAAAWLGIGRTHDAIGNYQAAIDAYREVVEHYPAPQQVALAHFLLGQAYFRLYRYAEAAAEFQAYLDLRPGALDDYVQQLRGDALYAAGDYPAAVEAYQAALQAGADYDTVSSSLGQAYAAQGDWSNAVRLYLAVYDATSNDYTKAHMNLLAAQAYTALGFTDQANARSMDSVLNFPKSYDSYLALQEVDKAGLPVNDLSRGMVYFYVQEYGLAIQAFDRYMANTPEHDGSAHYFKAYAYYNQGVYDPSLAEWESLIRDHPEDRFIATAWDEKAYLLWAEKGLYAEGAQALLDYVALAPDSAEAPQFLFEAGRIYERAGLLTEAADTWERLMSEYASEEISYRALFMAGLARYRLLQYGAALVTFQRMQVLAVNAADQSQARFWIGKVHQAQGDPTLAAQSFLGAAAADPTGYYSERARRILDGEPALYTSGNYNFKLEWETERILAEGWLRRSFNISAETDLSSPGTLASNPKFQRAETFWELGLMEEAQAEFESLRESVAADPADSFRLLPHLLQRGFYSSAILCARQVLDLAGLDDVSTLLAPAYFNHIRFGLYYQDLVLGSAQVEGLSPLLIYSLIRQESLFDGIARSSAGARGLMQIMPDTGDEIAAWLAWPPGYTTEDLYRPLVNITFGASYLDRWRDYFDGQLLVALAAYNAGPGNADSWWQLSGGDPDLFLELTRFDETRTYMRQISEFLFLYRNFYEVGE